ncbi:hypothetical protein JY651_11980 [Pyxidicoccus parkwayensis]|uniref:CBM21 domain-containing protein n=1 Tax=Pyxidicoccus parkwayensis TaxID=2813578 RepID=A0ABX7P535_9BACT|nr:carbohydrate-binding protein [Pyxidicoccus parkwaysis]QSQ25598.1 hypothetical protein JY651_11980 [Pyxidicoccus parkwaysis]
MSHANPRHTALLTLALLLMGMGTAHAQEPNVQLAHAKLQAVCGSTFCNRFVGTVEVKNLAYEKQVAIAYSTGDGQWTEVAAGYVAPASSGYETWLFTKDLPMGASVQFAIRYTVAGQTYWDNNGGNDYRLGGTAPTFVLGRSALKLDTASYQSSRGGFFVTGYVVLKNLGAVKDVKAVYTQNDWVTVQEKAATYLEPQPNSGGAEERWLFSIPVSAPTTTLPTVRFALAYTVDGVTYWDNNFTWNYSLNYPDSIQ